MQYTSKVFKYLYTESDLYNKRLDSNQNYILCNLELEAKRAAYGKSDGSAL